MKCGTSHMNICWKNILGRVKTPLTHLPRPTPKPSRYPGHCSHTQIPSVFFWLREVILFSQISPLPIHPFGISSDSLASVSRSVSKWSPVHFTLRSAGGQALSALSNGEEDNTSVSFGSSKKQEENTHEYC